MDKLKALRMPQVEDKTALKRSKIYELVATGKFPEPVFLLGKCRGWMEHEVDAWLLQRMEERDSRLQSEITQLKGKS